MLTLKQICKQNSIEIPKVVSKNLCLLTIAGSRSYCCANEKSDYDIFGFFMPSKKDIKLLLTDPDSPNLRRKWVCKTQDDKTGTRYEFFIYNFLDYVDFLAYGTHTLSPFFLESLFSDEKNIISVNKIGKMLYKNKHKFLTPQYFEYCLEIVKVQFEGFKSTYTEKYTYTPLKQACHAIRLLNECLEILKTGTFHATQKNSTIDKIRNGKVSREEITEIYSKKLATVEEKAKKWKSSGLTKFVKKMKLQGVYRFYDIS
jgi:hypothetical protein